MKVLCAIALTMLLASCGEAPAASPPDTPSASSTATPTLSIGDKEVVDKLGGDLKGLTRIMGNAMTNPTQRGYAQDHFLKALEAAGQDDLPILSQLSGPGLSEEVRAAIEEKRKTLK